jgi:hypothetical protein
MMATTSSPDPVPNYGMGLVTYICDETGPPRHAGQSPEKLIEDLIRLPLGSALYLRVNWKDVQQKSGRLDLCVNVWDAGGHSMSGSNDPTTRRKVFAWIAAHESTFYARREPMQPVGVYFSPASRNYYTTEFLNSYQGIIILLLQQHYEYRMSHHAPCRSFTGTLWCCPTCACSMKMKKSGSARTWRTAVS